LLCFWSAHVSLRIHQWVIINWTEPHILVETYVNKKVYFSELPYVLRWEFKYFTDLSFLELFQ